MTDEERLKRLLQDDWPDEEDTGITARQLAAWRVPQPTAAETTQLVERLQTELPRRSLWDRIGEWWPLLLLRAQIRIVRREIWAASALVMVLGVITTLGTEFGSGLTPLAILAPVAAAAGVALLYDGDLALVFELEDATPASLRRLLLARLTLIFGFNLGLSLAGSMILAVLKADILLWPLVLSWFAPMVFLSALAFWLSVVSGDSVAGMVFSLLFWGGHVVLRTTPISSPLLHALSLPGLGDVNARPMLVGAAVLLLAVGLWMVGRMERRIGDAG